MAKAPVRTDPFKTTPLGLPLLSYIQKDPLAAALRFQSDFGDVARLNILFRRIYYCSGAEAARQILVDYQDDFTREIRLLKIFASVQGINVVTTKGPDWQGQRRILWPCIGTPFRNFATSSNARTLVPQH